MNIKQAIIAKNGKAHGGFVINHEFGVDFRGPRKNFERIYSQEQIDYLFSHKLLKKYEPCGAFWEYPNMGEYWEFTKIGKILRLWYSETYTEFFYYDILKIWKINNFIEKLFS